MFRGTSYRCFVFATVLIFSEEARFCHTLYHLGMYDYVCQIFMTFAIYCPHYLPEIMHYNNRWMYFLIPTFEKSKNAFLNYLLSLMLPKIILILLIAQKWHEKWRKRDYSEKVMSAYCLSDLLIWPTAEFYLSNCANLRGKKVSRIKCNFIKN